MSKHPNIPEVGIPEPDSKTSPIVDVMDEEYEALALDQEGWGCCYYNGVAYKYGSFVASAPNEILHCENGVWVREEEVMPAPTTEI